MQQAEKELLDEKFKGVIALLTSTNDINSFQHEQLINKQEQILAQVLITNGRVTKLEKQTKVFRFMESNPKISIVIFIGVFTIASLLDFKDIINFFK